VTPIGAGEYMKTHDAQNERIKRRYFTFLKEANRVGEFSVKTRLAF
jgi:hypothetical protein